MLSGAGRAPVHPGSGHLCPGRRKQCRDVAFESPRADLADDDQTPELSVRWTASTTSAADSRRMFSGLGSRRGLVVDFPTAWPPWLI